MAQICVVKLQCKNRCWLVSATFSHNEHQDTIIFPFLLSTSCVRQALLATNHVKHFILVGAKVLHTFLHKLCLELCCCGLSILYALLTVEAPSLLCFHLKESGALVMPGNFSNSSSNLATLSTSQSFKNLLKIRSHPCAVQHSLIFASGLLHSKNRSGKDSFRGIYLFHASVQSLVLLPFPTSMYVLASSFCHKFLIVLQTPTP